MGLRGAVQPVVGLHCGAGWGEADTVGATEVSLVRWRPTADTASCIMSCCAAGAGMTSDPSFAGCGSGAVDSAGHWAMQSRLVCAALALLCCDAALSVCCGSCV